MTGENVSKSTKFVESKYFCKKIPFTKKKKKRCWGNSRETFSPMNHEVLKRISPNRVFASSTIVCFVPWPRRPFQNCLQFFHHQRSCSTPVAKAVLRRGGHMRLNAPGRHFIKGEKILNIVLLKIFFFIYDGSGENLFCLKAQRVPSTALAQKPL